jgi:hypothetical protein
MASTAPVVSSAPAASVSTSQKITDTITRLLDQYFKATLGSEPGILEYVRGLMHYESRLRPDAESGPIVSEVATSTQKKGSSRAAQYVASGPVVAILQNGTATQKRNISEGKQAHGIMQVMGWNIVRGSSSKTQKCEFQESGRADVAAKLLIDAGDSVKSKLAGAENLENNILAGLLLLEMKWKAVRKQYTGWGLGGDSTKVFPSRISAAIGAYLGTGRDLVTGVSVGGNSFRVANSAQAGSTSQVKTASAASSGPTTNGTGQKGEVVGC